MIIRERADEFIMIGQHDHAALSGDMARNLRKKLYEDSKIEEVILAAYEHDRSWIALDDTPIWNDKAQAPYSFVDYPLMPKLALYKLGLDEIEKLNAYAGLICSMHFCSFFQEGTQPECCTAFLQGEKLRQNNILNGLVNRRDETISMHLKILQFCDRLSLYVCLNEPGADKENEHAWYRSGIAASEFLTGRANQTAMARWTDMRHITVTPFPFHQPFQIRLKYKAVSKEAIAAHGLDQAYRLAERKEHEIVIGK